MRRERIEDRRQEKIIEMVPAKDAKSAKGVRIQKQRRIRFYLLPDLFSLSLTYTAYFDIV